MTKNMEPDFAESTLSPDAPWTGMFTRLQSLLASIPKTWESALWIVMGVAAILTRFWNLGARAMSHDESLHVYYSWLLSVGSGYTHNPMMHGPFLFEATAIFNTLFGASDFTSRLVPALLGIAIVVIFPLLLRPWFGRFGSLAAGLFFLISPYVLYYSRYNRHDIDEVAWVLLAAFAILSFLRSREDKYLTVLAVALALMLSTMETSFFYMAVFVLYLALRLVFSNGLSFSAIRRAAEFDLVIVIATLGAFFSSPIALLILNPIWAKLTGAPFVDLTLLNVYGLEWAQTSAGPRLWGLLALFATASLVIGFSWGKQRWLKLAGIFLAISVTLFTTFFTNFKGIGTGMVGSLGYWLSQQDVSRGGQPWYYYLIVFPLYEYLPLLLGILSGIVFAVKRKSFSEPARAIVPLVIVWGMTLLVGLSLSGEKMPWLSTHLTIPFILLAAWGVGALIERARSERVTEPSNYGDMEPLDSARPSPALNWISLVGVAALVLLTARTSYLVNYVNFDYTTEFIGYAHGAPGVKWTADVVDYLSRMTGEGDSMVVAYDSSVSWPMTWYLRDHTGYFGDTISRNVVNNAAVVIVGSANYALADQFLGTDYQRYEVIRIWWPMEDYKNLTWERIQFALTDPQMRQAVWDILWKRDYTRYAALTYQNMNPPQTWVLSESMRIYVRDDLANLIAGTPLAAFQLPDLQPPVDAYAGVKIDVQPAQTIDAAGLNLPRNLAVASDGSIYVADSANHRIVKLDASGNVLLSWGSLTPSDQAAAPPPGTFNEPWGIAVDASGNVYVADTWNYRIQKFDSQGNFLLQWGTGGLSVENSSYFWGPRAIAIAPDGNLYVADTGNNRIAVFDPSGSFLFEITSADGLNFSEPVGLAISPEGVLYVADTWNMRIVSLSLEGQAIDAWTFQGWYGDSIENKPYLAVDAAGNVYASDPESYRVIVFSADGEALAEFGQAGSGAGEFGLPAGLASGPDGQIWVADAGNNRVVAYAPVE